MIEDRSSELCKTINAQVLNLSCGHETLYTYILGSFRIHSYCTILMRVHQYSLNWCNTGGCDREGASPSKTLQRQKWQHKETEEKQDAKRSGKDLKEAPRNSRNSPV